MGLVLISPNETATRSRFSKLLTYSVLTALLTFNIMQNTCLMHYLYRPIDVFLGTEIGESVGDVDNRLTPELVNLYSTHQRLGAEDTIQARPNTDGRERMINTLYRSVRTVLNDM